MNRILSLIYTRFIRLTIALSALVLSAIGFASQLVGVKTPILPSPTSPYTLLIISIGLLLANNSASYRQYRWQGISPRIAFILSSLFLATAYVEAITTNSSNISLILLAVVLIVAVFATRGTSLFLILSTVLGMITAQYLVYTPSFGNDTWRDVFWAEYTLRYGDYTKSPVFHTAYPLPMVVLLYSMTSLALGITPLESSVITGLLYLIALPVLAMLFTRRAFPEAEEYSPYSLLVVYSIPTIAVWSVWFIPQAYAVLMFVAFMLVAFLGGGTRRYVAGVVIALALVFGHPGFSLIVSIALLWLSFGSGKNLRPFAVILALLTAFYDIYLTFSWIYSGGLNILLSLLGETKGIVAIAESAVPYLSRMLPWLSTIALIPLGYASYFATDIRRDLVSRIFLAGIFLYLVGYLASTLNPGSTIDRYVGIPDVMLLTLLAPLGLKKYLEGTKVEVAYAYVLIAVFIAVLSFGGTFTPYSKVAITPSWFPTYGVLTYGESAVVHQIAHLIEILQRASVLTDWRTGMIIYDYYVPEHRTAPVWSGFRVGSVTYTFLGYPGPLGDANVVRDYSGYIVFRRSSLVMSESWRLSPTDVDRLLDDNVLFSGSDIWLVAKS